MDVSILHRKGEKGARRESRFKCHSRCYVPWLRDAPWLRECEMYDLLPEIITIWMFKKR